MINGKKSRRDARLGVAREIDSLDGRLFDLCSGLIYSHGYVEVRMSHDLVFVNGGAASRGSCRQGGAGESGAGGNPHWRAKNCPGKDDDEARK
jgi:hypothetical protein